MSLKTHALYILWEVEIIAKLRIFDNLVVYVAIDWCCFFSSLYLSCIYARARVCAVLKFGGMT